MKFEIGDKVKVKNNLITGKLYGTQSFVCNMEKYKSKIVTIRNVYAHFYEIEEDRGVWYWTDEMFENEKQYTYEDLKKSPLGTKITFEKGEILIKDGEEYYESRNTWRVGENLKNLEDNEMILGKIIKIEEPTYETVYEYKPEILDEVEKRYLRGVIRPYKTVKYINKSTYDGGKKASLIITVLDIDGDNWEIQLPLFETRNMYQNMKNDKEYTLEELGL